jgi:aspartate-semialdehyde dehydrogenase
MKTPVGILGATGAVGQRFIQLLDGHPWFEVAALYASSRSAGSTYEKACHWTLSTPMPTWARTMTVLDASPDAAKGVKLIFSALPGDLAGPVEEQFAQAGCVVSSNASAHRMDADVPLVVTEVSGDHLPLIEQQRKRRGWPGFIVAGANCSSTHLVMALKPLNEAFGLSKVNVVTMQAVSGAGYPGVPSLDILGNVIPYIGGEEEKMEREVGKMLGRLAGDHVQSADCVVSAQCNRVAVRDGHTECVSIALKKPASIEEIKRAWREFSGEAQALKLPSAPARPVVYIEGNDRPQPQYDLDVEKGMATTVGRLRPCPLFDYKFVLLGHNTIRGAAGGALLNGEMLVAKGLIPR